MSKKVPGADHSDEWKGLLQEQFMKRSRILAGIIIVGALFFAIAILVIKNSEYRQEVPQDAYKGIDDTETDKAESQINGADSLNNMKYICLADLYDYNDDESLKKGLFCELENMSMEEEFMAYFFSDKENIEDIETPFYKVYIENLADKQIFVAIINDTYSEDYPKYAYGFCYSLDDAVIEAKYDATKRGEEIFDTLYSLDGEKYFYTDVIKPNLEYQEKEYIRDSDGNIVKVKYTCDAEKYGTFNSSGELYLDSAGRVIFRGYYTTSADRFTYYLYNDSDELIKIFDFGGMPYKGLEENPDIAIGVDMTTYIFER